MKRKYALLHTRLLAEGATPYFLCEFDAATERVVWGTDINRALRMSLKNAQATLRLLHGLLGPLAGRRPQIVRLQRTLSAVPTVAAYQPLENVG